MTHCKVCNQFLDVSTSDALCGNCSLRPQLQHTPVWAQPMDRKIIDYIVVEWNSIDHGRNPVTEEMQEGYVPLGGVSNAIGTYTKENGDVVECLYYAQAMVKYESLPRSQKDESNGA